MPKVLVEGTPLSDPEHTFSSPAIAGEGDHRNLSPVALAKGEAMVEGTPLSEPEKALMLALDRLPHTIDQAISKRAPNIICAFAFELAQSFSRFYAAHHILSEENETLRTSRLSLCRVALRELETLLCLLGIEVPERM